MNLQETAATVNWEQFSFDFLSECQQKQRQEEKRRKSQELLEKRVRERTLELAQAVESLQREVQKKEEAKELQHHEMLHRLQEAEEQREKERYLIQQNRLAAMGEMVNNIAHQWRQPLNTLGLYIQQMPIMFSLGEATEAYISTTAEKCMTIIHHMSATIDDFRNYFRRSEEAATFSPAEILQQAVSIMEGSFREIGIGVKLQILNDPPVTGHPGEFAQVILNILLNARDQLVENEIEAPEVAVTLSGVNGRTVIAIADNAGGIGPDLLDKIFEPYFTTKGPDKGTGIGLFMSKAIIEKNMGGTLRARNTGRGAEFIIEL
ncbi:sensor histidine kinase [Geobacter sp. DSM 9736]|uniref:sensor histidine kinase n=1 Tax=Geobacter sp. DSM 9736 TaxID=1277350 RepID=UPI000B50B287|nr:ATP-binding protein [Geobacter sp. DSM 9736]SNB44914.1 Histidine kinase-, DNA gyrase B-, and HSP90-like ATPase [Geobacter sp. DSM 9736]